MDKRKIDLSDIKEKDLDKTSSFTDLMSRNERKNRIKEKESNNDDIINMIEEKKRNTQDLTKEIKKVKEETKEEDLNKTQILDITRQMKFNFEETKKENNKKKKKGISTLNIIGEVNLFCIGYYIYLLAFTTYQEAKQNYLVTGSLIVLLVLLFGLSVVTGKKMSKVFNILNILTILIFIVFNAYSLIN